jgi:hypothetical protein
VTTTIRSSRGEPTGHEGRRTAADFSAPGDLSSTEPTAGEAIEQSTVDNTIPTIVNIKISDIDPALQPASQMRVQLDQEAIEAYAAHLDAMPPVTLFYDSSIKTHWVADGCHTIKAYQSRNKTSVPARVQQGSYQDAFHAAARANTTHGLRITNADKQHRVEEALRTWPKFSNRKIAEICGVDEKTVRNLKSTADSPQLEPDQKTIGRDGKLRKAHKSKIGPKGKGKTPISQPAATQGDNPPDPIPNGHNTRPRSSFRPFEGKC